VGAGILLFAVSLINGFLIHGMAIPRLALSAHLVGLIGSSLLIGLSAFWPRLNLTGRWSRVGTALALGGFVGGWLVYLSAAVLGAGEMFPLMSGGAAGPPLVERVLGLSLLVVFLAFLGLVAIVLVGLRGGE
jgi:hydroxylaminobenzene mutase